jgi:23S rRNA (cytosine1962-C5)-methyltransferase
MTDLIPHHWRDYVLLDCGFGKKLEQFGQNILIRPEPEAIWPPALDYAEWKEIAHAEFKFYPDGKSKWEIKQGIQHPWNIVYGEPTFKLKCRLQFGKFKNIGVFPEQASQWRYIYDSVKAVPDNKPRILNLFAHTGIASIVAAKAGGDVYHVEGLKTFINWANHNAELNGLKNIRWVPEDVIKFLKREINRKHLYHGIIADPPAFGKGPGKEKWVMERNLPELIEMIGHLLNPSGHFLVLNTYGSYTAPNTIKTLVQQILQTPDEAEAGTLAISSARKQVLTQGTFLRYNTNK